MPTQKKIHTKDRKKAAGRSTRRAAQKRTSKKPRRAAVEPAADTLAAVLFPSLKTPARPVRMGVFLAVADRDNDKPVVRFTRREISQTRSGRPSKRASSVLSREELESAADTLAGLAHPDRLQIAQAILLGASTHKALEQATQLKAGPLYHHVRSLERAGLVKVVARNTYSLTDSGQVSLLVISGLAGTGSTSSKKGAWRRIAVRSAARRRTS